MLPKAYVNKSGTHKNKSAYSGFPGDRRFIWAGFIKEFQGVWRHVILTAAANPSVKEIYDRMPVILPQGALKDWISDADWALAYLHGQMPALVIQKA